MAWSRRHVGAPKAVSRLGSRTGVEPGATRWGRTLQPVVGGFHEDFIAEEHPELTLTMSLRVAGRDADYAVDYPDATGHVVVFVHGLAEDEQARSFKQRPTYGERLIDDGLTPVFVRFNSGRHISDNGFALGDPDRRPGRALARCPWSRSAWSGTRWADWWPAAHAITKRRGPPRW